MSVASYLVGRPIYRAASNAPTRGTVDPMGYINRALGMSPVGGDGFSDKRSGLAQAALNRLRKARGGVAGIGHSPMMGVNGQFGIGGSFTQGFQRNPIDFGATGPTYHSGAIFAQPAQPIQQPPPQPGYTVSPIGQLLPNTGTPYDTTMAAMNGTQQAPTEGQLMGAARERLQHQIAVKEALTKHQINMQNMNMQAAQQINRHRRMVRRG